IHSHFQTRLLFTTSCYERFTELSSCRFCFREFLIPPTCCPDLNSEYEYVAPLGFGWEFSLRGDCRHSDQGLEVWFSAISQLESSEEE
ncbi:hypothetical protein KC19_3G190700, partial [Ceratodon purpureus]